MIATEQIIRLIRANAHKIGGITNLYLCVAPDEAVYPFITIIPVSLVPDYTFTATINTIRIQFSVFDNTTKKDRILRALKDIELLYHRQTNLTISDDCSMKLEQSLKENERIRRISIDGEDYWMGSIDIVFRVCMAVSMVDESSSTSSSSSHAENSSSSSVSSSSSGSSLGDP